MEALKFAPGTDDVIEGWGAPFNGPFGGKDLDGEAFTKNTDFCLDWFEVRPVLYDHGVDPDTGTSVVGRVKSYEVRDKGLWVQAQLDRTHEYFEAIKQMVNQNGLWFSSGAMAHLVRKPSKGIIARWPWVEMSLTPTPSNLLATLDFATAEKHYKSAGLDFDALKAKMDAEERNALPDSDFAYVDSSGDRHLPIHDAAHVRAALARFDQTEFESDSAKESAHRKILARAKELGIDVSEESASGKSSSLKSMEGSYEDLIADLSALLNPMTPFGDGCYSSIVATFPDYVLVCRYDPSEDEPTYWQVAYTTTGEDGDPVLGKATQVEQTYVPKKSYEFDGPLTLDATNLARHGEALAARTKGVAERRAAEGRVLSVANVQALMAACTTLDATKSALIDLLADSDQMGREQAKAAALASPDGIARRLAALRLLVETLPD